VTEVSTLKKLTKEELMKNPLKVKKKTEINEIKIYQKNLTRVSAWEEINTLNKSLARLMNKINTNY
jgi:hypothetical protein